MHHFYSLFFTVTLRFGRKALVYLLFLTLIALPVQAMDNNHFFRHYGVIDGLSDNLILSCVQDKYGFIWIGTRDGLNKFDGYTFKIYRNDTENKKSLGNNRVNHLALDTNNDLWVSTRAGIYKYNDKEDTFEQLPSTRNKNISLFQFDAKNKLWRLENGVLIREDVSDGSYKIYSLRNNLSCVTFCINANDEVWVSDSGGYLSLLDQGSGSFTSYDMFMRSSPETSKVIHRLYSSSYSSKIYMAYESDNLKVFDTSTLIYKDIDIQEISKSRILINCLLEIDEDNIWIGTDYGIFIYNHHAEKWERILPNSLDPYTIASHYNAVLFKDRENGIWVGHHQNGLSYHSPFNPFNVYYPNGDPNALLGGVIHDICIENDSTIWIATEDAGVSSYNKNTNEFAHLLPGPEKNNLAHTNIRGLVVADNKMWVGHIIHGIDQIDLKTRKVLKNHHLYKDVSTNVNSRVTTMTKTENGEILAATYDGIFKYDPATDDFLRISNQNVNLLYEDSQNRIWIGKQYANQTLSGYQQLSFQQVNIPDVNSMGEIYRFVDIYEDKTGNMWFATDNGLLKYNMLTDSIFWFTTNNGMPSNVNFRILPDDNENLWISTAGGLVKLDIVNNTIICFTEAHGLITRQFNYYAGLKDTDGSLFFGAVKGFIHFNPNDIVLPEEMTDVFITGIDISSNKREAKAYRLNIFPWPKKQTIQLNHYQSTFNLNFSTLSFIAPGSAKYAYRMLGIDTEWNMIGGRNTVYFTDLHHGQYTLEIKATDLAGNWQKSVPLKVDIIIHSPWWASIPAYIIYIVIVMLCVYFSFKFWYTRKKKTMAYEMQLFEIKKEKELYQAKIDFFINIAHDIRTPLTLIKTPLERIIKYGNVCEQGRKSLLLMEKNVTWLVELVNQLLDFRKAETEGCNLNFVNIDIVALLASTADRFRETAQKNALQLKIESSVKELNICIDKEAVVKIISNLFSNAVKYAKNSILVTLSNENRETVVIDFINDGEPIPNEHWKTIFEPFNRVNEKVSIPGTGLGLSLADFLIKKHNGKIDILVSTEEKTIFRIVLPVNQSKVIHSIQDDSLPESLIQRYPFDINRSSILIVEDNEEMRQLVADEISRIYNTFTAGNGKEALDIVKNNSINLIISDILMSDMDGFELLKEIKTNIEFSHIPVILLTAKVSIQARLEGLELGADAYIDKPFSMDLLLIQISNLLTNRENIRKFYFVSPIANMKSMAYSKADKDFLEKLNSIIDAHLSKTDFDVNTIANMLCMSRSTLYRKIMAISNLTPNDLIRTARLKKAAELLLQGEKKIYEVSEEVGFNSQSYFWSAFIKQFGVSPTKFVKNNRKTGQN